MEHSCKANAQLRALLELVIHAAARRPEASKVTEMHTALDCLPAIAQADKAAAEDAAQKASTQVQALTQQAEQAAAEAASSLDAQAANAAAERLALQV